MSSFNINGPGNKPVITEAQSMLNNGGGGNLGYMQGGSKKKKEKEEEPVLLEGEIEDEFVHCEDDEDDEDDEESSEISTEKPKETMVNKIGGFIKALNPNKAKKAPEIKSGDFLSLSSKKDKTPE